MTMAEVLDARRMTTPMVKAKITSTTAALTTEASVHMTRCGRNMSNLLALACSVPFWLRERLIACFSRFFALFRPFARPSAL